MKNTLIAAAAATIIIATCPCHSRDISTGKDVQTENIPQQLQGKFPIGMPECEAPAIRLVLLDSANIAIIVYDLPRVIEKVNELSGGELFKAVDDWEQSEKEGKPNWTAFKKPGKLHEQFLAQAREECGERKLDSTDFFKISSDNDENYRTPQTPSAVTRVFVASGARRHKGAHEVDYAHCVYIRLPRRMKNSCNYQLSLKDGGGAKFAFDEKHSVSMAIKVNQAGYLSDAPAKSAYLGAFAYELGPLDFTDAKKFSIIDANSGAEVFAGDLKLLEKNPRFSEKPGDAKGPSGKGGERPMMYGEDVYLLDFTGLSKEGVFFISIPGVGRSWPFRHGKNAYGEAFYTAARGLFHQRAATALDAKFTAWARPKSKMHDTIYECENISFPIQAEAPKGYSHFDVIGATTDETRKTENVIGGWYDAADWDRNEHHYVCVFDLLNAYEFFPKKFSDGQLNIPESGNGIPDILDEAAYGLECWLRSMDGRGGISGYIETYTHPDYEDPNCRYAFSRRTRWNSLCYAAAAAQLAHNMEKFDGKAAARFAESAKKAFSFGTDPRNSLGKVTINAKKGRGRGEAYSLEWEETDDINIPYLIHAKTQMFKLTGDKSLLDGIAELSEKTKLPFEWRFSHKDFSAWTVADIALGGNGAMPPETVDKWRRFFLKTADELHAHLNTNPYRNTWPRYQNYWAGWGANCTTNFNRCLAIAFKMTGDVKYLDAIIANSDFMLGANPLGMSWTTGIGFVYPVDIQHNNSECDGIMDPVPGISIYGINGGPPMHHRARELAWAPKGPDGKDIAFIKDQNRIVPFFRAWSCHPGVNTAQCEFTVHETMSSTIFTTAILLGEGWTPDATLKSRKPRSDQYLFGHWYLP